MEIFRIGVLYYSVEFCDIDIDRCFYRNYTKRSVLTRKHLYHKVCNEAKKNTLEI